MFVPIVFKKGEKMSDSIKLFAFIRPANSVSKEPEATMSNWTIHRVTFADGDISDHLVGFIHGKSGRTTSAIQSFNGELAQITTFSGRKYTLYGPPGFTEDGNYVWKNWKLKCRVIEDIDVSDQYVHKIKNLLN